MTDLRHDAAPQGDVIDDVENHDIDHPARGESDSAQPADTPETVKTVRVSALIEDAPGEKRVAIVPEVAATLVEAGYTVLIESGAGDRAWFTDEEYTAAGATVTTRADVLAADVLLAVNRPAPAVLAHLRTGQVLIGLLGAQGERAGLEALDARGVTPLSLDLLPRTLSRAQTMDALTSQASIAGYRAALLAASEYDQYFPMMMTAAGTARPAQVLVLGTGVAGLQAIGTTRRIGAQVTGYDVRPESREEVTSLGAKFLTTTVSAGASEGGYARRLTDDETAAQQAELASKIGAFSILITTAQVPGRVPPVLVTQAMLAELAPGSVVIDMAASELGGNVVGSLPGQTVVVGGVRIIGAGHLASDMPAGASKAYSRNAAAVLATITVDQEVHLDPADEVVGALWVQASTDPEGA